MAHSTSPLSFLDMPPEIRLAIYEHLLVDRSRPSLSIATQETEVYAYRRIREAEPQRRTSFRMQTGRLRSAVAETTYELRSRPDIHPAILGVSRQVHAEAARVLYGSYVFDFNTDVESVIPFLSDLTAPALSSIRRINLVKRARPFGLDHDRREWSAACEFLARHLELQYLGLGVFGARVEEAAARESPPPDEFKKSDFTNIARFDGMEWVQELVAIKGLRNLDIRAIWEDCPVPCSNALAFFVNFSASIENGFAEYLRENMVAGAA